ncbi:MAG: putative baseplate assembly protein [Candidatus Sulfotelmatobacter sp.]
MNDSNLTCQKEYRREDVRAASLFGLDYVEIPDEQQVTLNVFFLGKAPQKLEQANVVLSGGMRIRDVKIASMRVHRQADSTLDDYLEVHVNKPGDFSTYTIAIVNTVDGKPTTDPMPGFDSRYDSVCFTFKAGCPTDLDCRPQCFCPPPQRTQPDINYLAKDYESFRQLILDRLAVIMPAWNETHVPDLGITLVELLAYAGDYLSYYQDAVATEAYLGTARERISVRRHARMVDYLMHDGCNARAWLTIQTNQDFTFDDATQIYFITPYPGAPGRQVLIPKDLVGVSTMSYEVFEPLYWNGGGTTIYVYQYHSSISFYTWGNCECCLAPGATSATLADAWDPDPNTPPAGTDPCGTSSGGTGPSGTVPSTSPNAVPGMQTASTTGAPAGSRSSVASAIKPAVTANATSESDDPPGKVRRLRNLKVGDILIFEEVLGPKTGNPSDADPTHRQAVRLTKVTPGMDPLYGTQPFGTPIVEIEWASEDALTFTLCISSQQPPPDCGCLENVSVARGNVILVDNGSDTSEVIGTVPTDTAAPECPGCCQPASLAISSGLFRPVLTQEPLTFSVPLPPSCSAAAFVRQDPRQALPWISLDSIPPAAECSSAEGTDDNQPQPPCEIPPMFSFDDLADPTGLAKALKADADANSQFLLSQLTPTTRQALTSWDGSVSLPPALAGALTTDLTALLQTWLPLRDLLESGPSDDNFVVEPDNKGFGHLRFGDGTCGDRPDAGTMFQSKYRVGNGTAGNVGRDTITYIVFRGETVSGVNLQPRNPLCANGGVDPEPIDDVKQFAPYAFDAQLERAITAEDYATIATDNERRLEARATLEAEDPEICTVAFTRLQGAKAALRWTGSWYSVLVALDPQDTETTDSELVEEVTLYLEPFRRMGYDLLVSPAIYVPIKLSITICVLPNYQQAHVEAAVLNALSDRALPNGTLGFFHPDNLTFGGGIYISRLLATVQAIPGVQNAMVTELERFEISEGASGTDTPGEELPINSALLMGPFEIAQLDNDPNYPENGLLVLDVRGGR